MATFLFSQDATPEELVDVLRLLSEGQQPAVDATFAARVRQAWQQYKEDDATQEALADAMCPACGVRVAGASGLCEECAQEAGRLSGAAQAQQAEDATQEAQPVREHIQRVNDRLSVHLEDVDRDTVGVIVYDPNVKHAYVQVTVCADSDTINVYASSGREVVVKRYEDYFSHPDEHRTAVLSVSRRTATLKLETQCAYCGRNVDPLLDAVRLDHKRYLCPTCASKALRGEKMALDILARTQPGAATSAEDDLPF